ncbi:EscN/YscN/HrcN family type III secretion system ATPase [Candidatus Sodalis endolongispinus]|uniref:EscN/YscN/HrcN family type III secretion system ATPase n=1 Tax=Candidatus Sodalis endolongispinus TaxID=2812662 RepID=A0ABS5YDA5_9GAMM|nr:EscN/YscN/HrcN family type III secretion system ATPase [Candidatus Sodalis endolongispinus]MBT9433015.1 EscN/YscN/HrcN family type III secretion system ATPase [Candidatus Sodalis endolongispinus]
MTCNAQRHQEALVRRLTHTADPPDGYRLTGALLHIGATLLRARLPGVMMGEVCRLLPAGGLSEVVGIEGDDVLLSTYGATEGLTYGQRVEPLGRRQRAPVGSALLGRVIDGLRRSLDDRPDPQGPWRELDASPPPPLTRQRIARPLLTGIRAIDAMLTCGEGQRIGIFAAAGGGKSTLLSMLSACPDCDVTVLALIGERGREVREFLEQTLDDETRQRCVTIVATSDRPALERVRALSLATTIAEAFRDKGLRVLLLADSLTRYARGGREIALAAGETCVGSSYPPAVFAALPRLLERAGMGTVGSISAFYTVLVEGDDINEPLADEVRSLLDGHIILSRRLAEGGHFPAIDVLASLSRIMPSIVDEQHIALAAALRQLLSIYRDVELLVLVGEYQRGDDPLADRAVDAYPAICTFLQQRGNAPCDIDSLQQQLMQLTGNSC